MIESEGISERNSGENRLWYPFLRLSLLELWIRLSAKIYALSYLPAALYISDEYANAMLRYMGLAIEGMSRIKETAEETSPLFRATAPSYIWIYETSFFSVRYRAQVLAIWKYSVAKSRLSWWKYIAPNNWLSYAKLKVSHKMESIRIVVSRNGMAWEYN